MSTGQEQRRFFRIDDTVKLSYQVVGQEPSPARKTSNNQVQSDTMAAITQFDDAIYELSEKLSAKNPEVARLALLLNQKLDQLALKLLPGETILKPDAHKSGPQRVNISACGIAFIGDQDLEPNTRVQLEVTLPGLAKPLNLLSEIVACDQVQRSNKYRWRLNYVNILPALQEGLIQYIVKRQAQQLAEQRKKKKV